MRLSGTLRTLDRHPVELFLEKHGMKLWKAFVAFFVVYVLLPPLLLVVISFEPSGVVQMPTGFTFRWYDVMANDYSLQSALLKSIILAFLTTGASTLLAIQAALGFRKTKHKTIVIAVMILPIFLPGIIQGFSLSTVNSQFFGAERGLWTELAGHVMWALPFAFLVILTSMSALSREWVLAALDLGANPWRAFKDIEYPIIKPGITSAAIFSFVLSFNEFSRTFYLYGIGETLPIYVWNRIFVATSPQTFAISALTVILSLTLIGLATSYLSRVGRVTKETAEKPVESGGRSRTDRGGSEGQVVTDG
jgi:spermidine/putrescine transport system permease protein